MLVLKLTDERKVAARVGVPGTYEAPRLQMRCDPATAKLAVTFAFVGLRRRGLGLRALFVLQK